jgi:hypothetical protein
LQSGGGAWCASTNAMVANCVLSNNFASYGGGGVNSGTLNNSLVVLNVANYGGGAYNATLNNCTVQENYAILFNEGGGTYAGFVQNSIVRDNFDGYPNVIVGPPRIDDFATFGPGVTVNYSYCCSDSIPNGPGNIDADPHFLDLYHISIDSPCRGAGSALYASGTDLDGEPWNNPPSIGCDEVVVSDRVGPLAVSISSFETNLVVSSKAAEHEDAFSGTITGLATYFSWDFGDGPAVTNADLVIGHSWTNAGDYTVAFTAYNISNPTGVPATQVVHVMPLNPTQIQPPAIISNSLVFQFSMQESANYTVQYATNLTPPVTWLTLQNIYDNFGGTVQIHDSAPTNAARFYRVLAQ